MNHKVRVILHQNFDPNILMNGSSIFLCINNFKNIQFDWFACVHHRDISLNKPPIQSVPKETRRFNLRVSGTVHKGRAIK